MFNDYKRHFRIISKGKYFVPQQYYTEDGWKNFHILFFIRRYKKIGKAENYIKKVNERLNKYFEKRFCPEVVKEFEL